MKIDTITIEGFRSIKGPIEISLSQISAFIGANNAGKSNILSAIHRVLGRDWVTVNTFDDDDVFEKNYDQNIKIDISFVEPFKYEQFKDLTVEIPKIRFHYTRYQKGEFAGQRRLEKQCLKSDDKPVFKYKSRPQKGVKPEFEPLTTIPQELQENIPVIYIGIDRSLKSQLPTSRYSLLNTLMKDINKDFEREDNVIVISNKEGKNVEISRRERFNQCIKAAMVALRTEDLIDLETKIRTNALHQLGFDPNGDQDKFDIQFSPLTSLEFFKSLELFVVENNFKINATELGGGFQNAIVIAIMKAFEERRKEGAIFLIEEPEMFLHPQMQRSLYKTLKKIGENNQVIYITHSPHFVSIPEFDEIRIVRKTNGSTEVIQSTLNPDVKLKEKLRKELDPERNELFFAKRILLVEGDTEKLSLPEYAKRQNKDLDRQGVTIIEVGGKRNLKDFVELALSFQIQVGIIYDLDSTDFGKDQKGEEIKYNEMLESYAKKGVAIFRFDKNYEAELRKEFGETNYQKYCSNYGGYSKAIRARLFAIDAGIPIPKVLNPIIDWLCKGA